MNYYIREILSEQHAKGQEKHAGGKARKDINQLLQSEGAKNIDIPVKNEEREEANLFRKVGYHFCSLRRWINQLKAMKKGDTLYVQFPIADHFIFQGFVFEWLKRRGIKVVLMIHDLTLLREVFGDDVSLKEKIRLHLEEKAALKKCSKMIVHNYRMKNYLSKMHIDQNKMIKLRIFDYLIPDWDEQRASKRVLDRTMPVMIAGNLNRSKAGYVYHLPSECDFHLYGVNYNGPQNASKRYLGAFLPEELPYVMQGSFGLVWDGETSETCSGVYGKYLQINNPHKTSLYLASGIPVIIWEKAALADFIKKQKVGLTVKSLNDLNHIMETITEDEYREMLANARKLSEKLRSGYFTKHALDMC